METITAPLEQQDLTRLGHILSRAFGFPADETGPWLEKAGWENVRVARPGKTIDGCLLIIPMGQWFGGRSVPMAGLAGVAVAAEARGRGVSARLLRDTLQEFQQRRFYLSALYPSTQPVYRKVGYELAGSHFEVKVPTARINVASRGNRLRAIGPADRPAVEALYHAYAPYCNGWLDRGIYVWRRVFEPGVMDRGQDFYGFMVDGPDGPEGYVSMFTRRRDREYDLQLKDVIATTTAAADQLLTLIGDHRSTVDTVIWGGSAIDPLLMRLPDKAWQIRLATHWMLRIVDVVGALEARGYPLGLTGELNLEVYGDDVLPTNNGRFVIQVAEGRATVEPGGSGGLNLSIRSLAPLYSGFMTPWALHASGLLKGSPRDLALASAFFSGETPTLRDFF